MSVDGCLGSSACGSGGGSSGGRREEGGGPRGLHTLTLSSSLGGKGGGAAERGGQGQFHLSSPVSLSPLALSALALRELRLRVAVRSSEAKRARRAGNRARGEEEDAHPAVPYRHVRLYEPAH